MPLNTQVIRKGEAVEVSWSHFHIAAMAIATMFEHPEDWQGARPNEDIVDYPLSPQPIGTKDTFALVDYGVLGAVFPTGEYTLQNDHAFIDCADGEIFRMQKGDTLK